MRGTCYMSLSRTGRGEYIASTYLNNDRSMARPVEGEIKKVWGRLLSKGCCGTGRRDSRRRAMECEVWYQKGWAETKKKEETEAI